MSIPGNANPLLLRTVTAAATGISRSIRLNSADSAYLSRTPASAGNRKTWTWAGWVKRSALGSQQALFSSTDGVSNTSVLQFLSGDQLEFYEFTSSSYAGQKITAAVYRDPSAWYHVTAVRNTTSGTASERMRLYVNGVEVTTFSTNTNPNQNADSRWNSTVAHDIGRLNAGSGNYGNYYLADVHFIDGQALDPTSFGETDATTGVWNPKAYTGSYGTNGYHLEFADNSAATATTLGKDTSGNSPANNWTPNNFQVGNGVDFTATASASPSGNTTFYTPINNLFDSDDNTAASADYAAGDTTDIVVTFNPAIVAGSTLTTKIYQYQTYHSLKVNSGSFVTASSSVVDLLSGHGISAGSSITSITYRTTSPTPSFALGNSWYYIKNNGANLLYAPAGNDSLVDVPTNGSQVDSGIGGEVRGNYAVWNPIGGGGGTLSNGNLEVSTSTDTPAVATQAMTTGKWYWEVTLSTASNVRVGVYNIGAAAPTNLGGTANGWAIINNSSRTYHNGSLVSYGSFSGSSGNVVMLAYDADAGKLWFGENGTWLASGNPATGANPSFSSVTGSAIVPAACSGGGSNVYNLNTGQRAFAYTAPSGFKALCTANLPAPSVTKPSTVFDVKLYTGNGSTQTISGLSFGTQPGLLWIKSRSNSGAGYDNILCDNVRGSLKYLESNRTDAEYTSTAGNDVSSFITDGFTLGPVYNFNGINGNGTQNVAWLWNAGSSTVTNTAGSITSSVRANATAGFSVITYTGNGSTGTVGHGLGVAPQFIIYKIRNASASWQVYHASLGATKYLNLDTTDAATTSSTRWNDTTPSSTVVSLGTNGAQSYNYVMYAFSPVVGYSSFGSYTGNGSSDGVFQWCGFRPRWILLKSTGANGASWTMFDTARSTYNQTDAYLFANASSAEGNAFPIDILSNGFKLRTNDGLLNSSSYTYVWAAFAESPFNYARAR